MNRMLYRAAFAALVFAAIPAAVPVRAQGTLPSAEKVLNDADAAQGGRTAVGKIKTIVQHATMTVAAQKLSGTMEMRVKLPNKVYTRQVFAGIGETEGAFDGTVAWSRDPINGLRVLPAAETQQMKSSVSDMVSSDWHQQYKAAVLLGVRKVGTVKTYAVRLTPKTGSKPVVIFFDTKTKLPVRQDMVVVSPQGSIPTQNFFSDYRRVGGYLFPFQTRQIVGSIEVTIVAQDIQVNVPVADSLFGKPAAAVSSPSATKP